MGHSLQCLLVRKSFKRRELSINLSDGPFQHLAVCGAGSGLQLISHALARKQKSLTLAVQLLLGGRKTRAGRLARGCHLSLLFFY